VAERRHGKTRKPMSFVVRLLYLINDAAPWLKRLVPRGLHRFVLLKLVNINRDYDVMLRENPERLFLSNEVMPWVAANCRKVLFVGTSSYTFQYERLFADDPDRYFTIDKLASARVWGSRHHIVALLQEVHHRCPPSFFDAIVCNGVLFYQIPETGDFGIGGTPKEMDELSSALATVLKPGGLMVFGWNGKDEPPNLSLTTLLAGRFSSDPSLPWGVRRTFAGDTHVFEFFRRKSD
jgi:SAM-dependent methyltransferase